LLRSALEGTELVEFPTLLVFSDDELLPRNGSLSIHYNLIEKNNHRHASPASEVEVEQKEPIPNDEDDKDGDEGFTLASLVDY